MSIPSLIPSLITGFTTSCWVPSAKALIVFLKTLDKKIPNFQLFFNAKKYNSTNKVSLSDKERYDVMVEQLIEQVCIEESFKIHTFNYGKWIYELTRCLKSEIVYGNLSSNFLKGSYGKMIDDFNRILLPKSSGDDDDETEDPTENLKKYIKNYSQDFDKIVKECVSNGYKLYKSIHLNQEDDDTPIKEEMLKQEHPVFSIYAFREIYYEDFNCTKCKLLGLWISDKVLEYPEIDLDEYLALIKDIVFNLNPEHLTNMDTIKRNYVNKQWDSFKAHVKMLESNNSLFFYKAIYSHSADYDSYSELQFANAVNSFPISFEDYTKNAFGIFYFDKGENVTVTTYWITSKPIEQVFSSYDKGLFDWIKSDCSEFLTSGELHLGASTSMLH
jgi:hypothetical protein